MPFPEFQRLSPNYATQPSHECLGVCFHHSVSNFEATITRMMDRTSEVSYHVLIAPDGARGELVADQNLAWHAGASSFLNRSRCNDFLLGVAFAGDTYATPLTDAQMESALEWLESRWAKYRWTSAVMTDHRQISPGRKDDLNPTEWARLDRAIQVRFGSL